MPDRRESAEAHVLLKGFPCASGWALWKQDAGWGGPLASSCVLSFLSFSFSLSLSFMSNQATNLSLVCVWRVPAYSIAELQITTHFKWLYYGFHACSSFVSLNLPRPSLPYEHTACRQHSSSHMSLPTQCNFVFSTVELSTKQRRLKCFAELKRRYGRNYSKYRAVCSDPTFLPRVCGSPLHTSPTLMAIITLSYLSHD